MEFLIDSKKEVTEDCDICNRTVSEEQFVTDKGEIVMICRNCIKQLAMFIQDNPVKILSM